MVWKCILCGFYSPYFFKINLNMPKKKGWKLLWWPPNLANLFFARQVKPQPWTQVQDKSVLKNKKREKNTVSSQIFCDAMFWPSTSGERDSRQSLCSAFYTTKILKVDRTHCTIKSLGTYNISCADYFSFPFQTATSQKDGEPDKDRQVREGGVRDGEKE